MTFFDELKRRNVFRVGIAYGLVGWLVLQAADFALDLIDAPNWVIQALTVVIVAGLLLALFFAWAFELTPEGLKRDHEVDRSDPATPRTGRGLNRLILVLAVITAAYFFWESRYMNRPEPGVVSADSEQVPVPAPAAQPRSETGQSPSIAVMPFVNMSSDPENEYFADGLSEEIINRLAQVPQLRVIGRSSSFAFKGDNRDLREIGELLDVTNVLEGSVRRQGDEIRVTAQLITTSDGGHLWSQNFDRQLEDTFEVQDEIAQRVVDALDIVMDDAARHRMLRAGVRNVDAFVAYQKGMTMLIEAHAGEGIIPKLEAANVWLNRAAELAPPFAQAVADTSDLYAHRILDQGFSREEREEGLRRYLDILDKAHAAARDETRKAMIALDRGLFADDWRAVPRLMDEALSAPGAASSNWMELLQPFADEDRLIAYYERQVAYNPMFLLSHALLADLYRRQGRQDRADSILEAARAIDAEHRWVRFAVRQNALHKGQIEEARNLTPVDQIPFDVRLPALIGDLDAARNAYEQWLAEGPRDARQTVSRLAMLGDREGANAAAREVDALPGGPMDLIRVVYACACGAPFDLEATPNLARRLEQANFNWPPPPGLKYPAKTW